MPTENRIKIWFRGKPLILNTQEANQLIADIQEALQNLQGNDPIEQGLEEYEAQQDLRDPMEII